MSIKVTNKNKRFVLNTKSTTYVFEVFKGHYLMHNYYGKTRQRFQGVKPRSLSFGAYEVQYGKRYSPDAHSMEISFYGSGDF